MSSICWGRRTVDFLDAEWHRDGFGDRGLACRVFAMKSWYGLQLLPTATGRQRCLYLACIAKGERGAVKFSLLSVHPSLVGAQRACERHIDEHTYSVP